MGFKGGVHLSHRIRDVLKSSGYRELPCGGLDITFYRDDLRVNGRPSHGPDIDSCRYNGRGYCLGR